MTVLGPSRSKDAKHHVGGARGGHAPDKTRSRYVGSRMQRLEDPALLLGQGTFVDDVHLPGTLHAAFVRSPYAHARLGSVDVEQALRSPGVVAVFTGADLTRFVRPWRGILDWGGMKSGEQYPLAVDKVRYVGEPVALVVAEDRYRAEDALGFVRVEYEWLPPVMDPEEALSPEAPLLHEDLDDNLMFATSFEAGDLQTAFEGASLVLQRTFRTHRHTAAPLEPRGIVAYYDRARRWLTVYISTQAAHMLQTAYAGLLGLDENRVQIITGDVGGSFGAKTHVYPDEVAVCAAAILLGRPVKWIQDRMEGLQTDTQARDERFTVELALDMDGTIRGMRTHVLSDGGAFSIYPRSSVTEGFQVGAIMPGPYRIRNYAYDLRVAMTNKSPLAVYRAVGHPPAILGMEAMMDAAARALGLDPAEIRRRNLVRDDEFPYRSVTGYLYDSGRYLESLERLVALAELPRLRREQARLRQQGRYLGLGLACFVELTAPGSQFYGGKGAPIAAYDEVELRIEPTGKVVALLGTAGQGQGLRTTAAQVIADELGVSFEDIEVIDGDTKLTPHGTDTWGSRSAVVSLGAAAKAARTLRARILQVAAHLLEADPGDLEIAEAQIWVRGAPGSRISLREVASVAHFHGYRLPAEIERGLHVLASYEGPPATFNNGVHLAVVEVDPETGEVRMLDYFVVEDAGPIINPAIVDGQVCGGIAQGVGEALLEELVYAEDGQLLNATLMDYLVPSAAEVPPVHIAHLETPSPLTLLGTKGIGEAGLAGAPAAILNAVNDALAPFGAEVTEVPITPEKVIQAIRVAQGG